MIKKIIGWVLPDINNSGSGGIKTILDHIKDLSELYDQFIYTPSTKKCSIEEMYGKLPDNIKIKTIVEERHDLIFATWWETVNTVLSTPTKKKAYFIQDLEHFFYPISDNFFKAKETYSKGLIPIVIGKYLKESLKADYYYDFCADLNIYRPIPIKKNNAICFHYQPEKAHRCSGIGLDALKSIKKSLPELTIYLYGSDFNPQQEHLFEGLVNLGKLNLKDCNKLYNICELGICFSGTNPSRIPFEMMATGLPVLDIDIKNKHDFPDHLLYLSMASSGEIAQRVTDIFKDKQELSKRRVRSLEFMKNRPLTLAFDQFRGIVTKILESDN